MFSCEFFEIIKGNFFVKYLRASLLNADHWKDLSDCWSKIIFFSLLRFLILNDSILADLFMGCKNSIFKLFSKEPRNSSEFSEIFVFDRCCKGCKSFINICYLHDFFPCMFHVILALGWSNSWSNGVHGNLLIIFLFLLNISLRTVLIKNLFWLTYFLWSFSLLSIDLIITVVIHGFLSACGTLAFNNIYTTKFKRVCRLSFTNHISRLDRLLR